MKDVCFQTDELPERIVQCMGERPTHAQKTITTMNKFKMWWYISPKKIYRLPTNT